MFFFPFQNHRVVFVAVYDSLLSATLAKQNWHGYDCKVFNQPGDRLIVEHDRQA
jgi:hypothetical protein